MLGEIPLFLIYFYIALIKDFTNYSNAVGWKRYVVGEIFSEASKYRRAVIFSVKKSNKFGVWGESVYDIAMRCESGDPLGYY